MAAKIDTNTKIETFGTELIAKQSQKTAGVRTDLYIIDKFQLLRKEAEMFSYKKHAAKIELDKLRITSKQGGISGSDELLADQLKE